MQFEYDPERLIEEVKLRPCLWDFDHINYRTKKIKDQQWGEVVRVLLDGNQELGKSELRELELQMQKKWKCIRDNFVRYLQNPNRTTRPYIYSSKLTFLLKGNQNLPTRNEDKGDSVSESDEPPKQTPRITMKRKKREWVGKKKIKLSNSSEDDVAVNEESNSNDASTNAAAAAGTYHASPGRFAFANVEARLKDDTDDCDKLFLLSLLPHLKAIPEENKLNAKMQLLQVLNNAGQNYFPEMKII